MQRGEIWLVNFAPQIGAEIMHLITESYMNMKARYLNPFTEFGFKKLFGELVCDTTVNQYLLSIPRHSTMRSNAAVIR